MSDKSHVPRQAPQEDGLMRFWAWAFLWMPGGCALLFLATIGPSSADDIVMILSLPAIPVVCGVAACKVARSNLASKKVWAGLNLAVTICAALGAIALLVLFVKMGSALKNM